MAELDLLLELGCYHGGWIHNVVQGVDHFIEYLHFTMMSIDDTDNASKLVEYFMLCIHPTLPYYRHATLVKVVEISPSSSSSSYFDVPVYVPQLHTHHLILMYRSTFLSQ